MNELKNVQDPKSLFSKKEIKSLHRKIKDAIENAQLLKELAELVHTKFNTTITDAAVMAANMQMASNSMVKLTAGITAMLSILNSSANPMQETIQKVDKKARLIAENFEKYLLTTMESCTNLNEINVEIYITQLDQILKQLLDNSKIFDESAYEVLDQQYLHLRKQLETGFKPDKNKFKEHSSTTNTFIKEANSELFYTKVSINLAGQQLNQLQQVQDSLNFEVNCLHQLLDVISTIQFQSAKQHSLNEGDLKSLAKQMVDLSRKVNFGFVNLEMNHRSDISKLNQLSNLIATYSKKLMRDKAINPLFSDDLIDFLNRVSKNMDETISLGETALSSIITADTSMDIFKMDVYYLKLRTRKFERLLKSLNRTLTQQNDDLDFRNKKLLAFLNEKDQKKNLITLEIEKANVSLNSLQAAWEALNKTIL